MTITPLEYENLKAELLRAIVRYGLKEVKEALQVIEILSKTMNGRMPTFF